MYLVCHFGLIFQLNGQIEVQELASAELRMNHLAHDAVSNSLFNFSVIQDITTISGTPILRQGGDDLVLSRLNESLSVSAFKAFGSTSDDEVSFLKLVENEPIVGGLFWEQMDIDDMQLDLEVGNRGGFLARFDSELNLQGSATVSSTVLVRLFDLESLFNGNLLLLGWSEGDLFLNETELQADSKGVFLIEMESDFSFIRLRFYPSSDLVNRGKIASTSSQTTIILEFKDSLQIDDDLFTTRAKSVSNTIIFNLDVDLQSKEKLFIKSSFSNDFIADANSNELNELIINFRGNLTANDLDINGLPTSYQAISLQLSEDLQIQDHVEFNSTSSARFSVASSTINMYAGNGILDNWISSPMNESWLGSGPESVIPQFAPITGEMYFFDQILPFGDQFFISGIYNGDLLAGEFNLNNQSNTLQPFYLIVDIKTSHAKNDVLVIPNPVFDRLTISNIDTGSELKIYDSTGRLILTSIYDFEFNVATLHAGLYFIEVQVGLEKKILSFVKT